MYIHIHLNIITTTITHDLFPSGLADQLVEKRTIKTGGRGFDSRRGWSFFLGLVRSPISLLGLTLFEKFMGSL